MRNWGVSVFSDEARKSHSDTGKNPQSLKADLKRARGVLAVRFRCPGCQTEMVQTYGKPEPSPLIRCVLCGERFGLFVPRIA